MEKVIITLIVACSLTLGCTSVMGTVEPKEFTSVAGETVLACEVKGWSISVGDGGLCRTDDSGYVSTQEGGRLSETVVGLTTGILETGGRIAAGFFGGIGGLFSGASESVSPE